jgi:hypothetical protein
LTLLDILARKNKKLKKEFRNLSKKQGGTEKPNE